jgi:nucleoid DNA-binding protein
MTQKQFSKAVAEDLSKRDYELNPKDVEEILDVVSETLYKNVKKKDETVTIKGLGRFKLKRVPAKKARMGRNPATGEQINIGPKPASKKIKATIDKGLRDRLGSK